MNRRKFSIAASGSVITLAAGLLATTSLPSVAAGEEATIPSTPAEHMAAADRYEQQARELEAAATKHSELAAQYRARATGGSKQATGMRSLGNHCKKLAEAYQTAASESLDMAKMHREMAKSG